MNSTIINHLDQAFGKMMGIKPKINSYKFTIIHNDYKTEPTIKASTYDEAEKVLSYWYPGDVVILGCRETEL